MNERAMKWLLLALAVIGLAACAGAGTGTSDMPDRPEPSYKQNR